jgi:hypothetical protein
MLNLLSLQAELMHLRVELDFACKSDDNVDMTIKFARRYAFSFKLLRASAPEEIEVEIPIAQNSPPPRQDSTVGETHCCAQVAQSPSPPPEGSTVGETYCCACRRRTQKVPKPQQIEVDGRPITNSRTEQWELILKIRAKLKEYSRSKCFGFFVQLQVMETHIGD